MIAIIAINIVYVNNTCDMIYKKALAIDESEIYSEETLKSIIELGDTWERNRPFVEMSISHPNANRITELVASVRSYYESRDFSEFKNAKSLLVSVLSDICHLDRFNIGNIF